MLTPLCLIYVCFPDPVSFVLLLRLWFFEELRTLITVLTRLVAVRPEKKIVYRMKLET